MSDDFLPTAEAIYLGQFTDNDGRDYKLRLLSGPERVELDDGREPGNSFGDGPLTLEIEDLLSPPEPWQLHALRVHRGSFFFALSIREEDRQRLQESYRTRLARLRLRSSGLSEGLDL